MAHCNICNDTGMYRIGKYQRTYICTECAHRSAIKYAGLAPSDTPPDVVAQMKMLGALLGARGIVLRALPDTPYEAGAESVNGPMVLRTRRMDCVLYGDRGDQPVSFVVCYGDAPDGLDVPVFDLARDGAFGEALAYAQ